LTAETKYGGTVTNVKRKRVPAPQTLWISGGCFGAGGGERKKVKKVLRSRHLYTQRKILNSSGLQ